jgi:hypothetical protein
LKKQSEEQVKRLHKELEKRRMEAFEKEQQQWKQLVSIFAWSIADKLV